MSPRGARSARAAAFDDAAPAPIPLPSAPHDDIPNAYDAGVVDIGSNSVRLVIYRIVGRDFTPVLNDRVAAGLGREVSRTGLLAPDGVATALAALRRFRRFLEARGVAIVDAVATAAVREASDGPAFRREAEAALGGVPVRVLSGEDESLYAAYGVLAGDPDADGLVADFGGSSLEIAAVKGGKVGRRATFSLGAFALVQRADGDLKAARILLDEELAKAKVKTTASSTLYMVGGAWRNLAKVDMTKRDYPLRFLQGYQMSVDEATDIARLLAKQSPAAIARMPEVSRRRAESMPFAALALERLIKRFPVAQVEVSAYGLREGVLLSSMPDAARGEDPLIAGVDAMARRAGSEIAFGRAAHAWIKPLASHLAKGLDPKRGKTLLAAACRLADIGCALHPDHRAELAERRVLFAQFAGASHPERVFLARTTHHRYAGRAQPADAEAFDRILAPEARTAALQTGLALRLAGSISGRAALLLKETALRFDRKTLTLSLSSGAADLATEVVDKRLAQLAEALGAEAKITSG